MIKIKKLAEGKEKMISPFVDKSISQGISYGLNSFGYDVRCQMNLRYLQT